MADLMPFAEAIKAFDEIECQPIAIETVDLPLALNRVIAKDIAAEICVPPHDNSAMDGYAFHFADWQEGKVFEVSQRVPAGTAPSQLVPGTCARIFTGANIPYGADTVVMQEESVSANQGVIFPEKPSFGDNVRPKGQDIQTGKTVVQKGTKLTPMHIGLLSSLGIEKVTVYRLIKVGILTTGDELIPPGSPLKEGQIYNSNGAMLCALVQQAGYTVSECLHAQDTPESTERAIKHLLECSDVILSSGGVSVGEEDHVKGILEKLGQVHLWKIAVKPGKPLVHASLGKIPFLGLPGNPSSTLVTFHWFARRLLALCAGASAIQDMPYSIKAGFSRPQSIKRDEFIRVSIGSDGRAYAHPQQSSGTLIATCESHGYLHIKAHTHVETDQAYPFYPFTNF